MPIGKDSIRKRVIGSDCAACGECTDKAPLAEKTTVSERAPLAGKAPAAGNAPAGQAPVRRSPGRPRKTPQTQTAASGPVAPAQSAPAPAQKPASAPAVTESVLTNVSPEVVEKVTGHAEGATSDHVQITDRMPDYLL
ncbi:MAG: hypothetical protein MRZ53_07155 [Oscillospiraceae bacterium]|nr:hypothetical protein [Oscillospiraceae bacterium]